MRLSVPAPRTEIVMASWVLVRSRTQLLTAVSMAVTPTPTMMSRWPWMPRR